MDASVNPRHTLQRLAVHTQYPPFLWCYRLIYVFAIWLCTRRLKRIPDVRAIYLRRGLAGGRPIYGLSDIDLLVMVEGELSGKPAARVRHQYDLLRCVIPMLPEPAELGIYNKEYFRLLYERSTFYRGRFDEGRRSWKRLYGDDIFQHLPPPRADAREVAWQELRPAWNYLALEIMPEPAARSGRNNRPSFVRKYVAYKAVAEAARASLIAQGEVPALSRDRAIVQSAMVFPDIAENLKEVRHMRKNLLAAKVPDRDALLHTYLELARKTFAAMPQTAAVSRRVLILPVHRDGMLLSTEDLVLIGSAGAELGGVDRIALIPRLSFDAVATLDLDPVELAGATADSFDLVLLGRSLPFAAALRRFNERIESLRPLVNSYFCDGEIAVALRPTKGWAIMDKHQAPEFFAALDSARPFCGRVEIAGAVECDRPFDGEDALELRAQMLLGLFGKPDAFQLPARSFFTLFWEAGRAFVLAKRHGDPVIEVPAGSAQIVEALLAYTPAQENELRSIHAEYLKEAKGMESEACRYMNWAGRYATMLDETLGPAGRATVPLPVEARTQLTISVNIITRNRAPELKKALQSLVGQQRFPDQVVVVDNASTDNTAEIAKSFADRLPLTLVREERIGIPIARNTALAHSTGDIVAMLDDDCVAERMWLAWIEKPFIRDPHVAAVGGCVAPVAGRRGLVARFYDIRMRDNSVREEGSAS
jgi:hypothetical protein